MKIEKHRVYLLIGTNQGDRQYNIKQARKHIREQLGDIILISGVYESAPWGFVSETNFLNQAIEIETKVSANECLNILKQIEQSMGREITHIQGYTSRIIDIDILFFNSDIINTDQLTVPHKLMHERRFVLKPMLEIAPEYVHPVFQQTIQKLFESCKDTSEIIRIDDKCT